MPRLRAVTGAVGARLVIDASQEAGAAPIDAVGWDADPIVSSGYKWLGGHGGVAIGAIHNADTLTAAGAGLTLEEDERSAGDIHAALVRLLDEDAFSTAARRLAAEIADLSHPDDHGSTLQPLVSG